MPHQWILWRSLFDRGEGALAFQIADTALKVWKRETDETYCCFEHFMSRNGRGSGFHQFSGLSTPVLLFFEAYYTPGTVTVGFETTLQDQKWNDGKTAATLTLSCEREGALAVICMRADGRYQFTDNGRRIEAKPLTDGAYEIQLSRGQHNISVEYGF
jgi:hypothetical protein